MPRPGLPPSLMLILAAPMLLSGCIGTLLGLATAPAQVGVEAATQTEAAVASRVPLDDQTVSDLDRILAANPEAQNAAELGVLRERLANQPRRGPGQDGPSVADDPERRARWDRRARAADDAPAAWRPMQSHGSGAPRGDRLAVGQAPSGAVPIVQGVRQRPAPQAPALPEKERIGFAQPDWDAAVIINGRR